MKKKKSVTSGGVNKVKVLPDEKMQPNEVAKNVKSKSVKSKNAKVLSDQEMQQNAAYGIPMVPLKWNAAKYCFKKNKKGKFRNI